MKQKKEEQQLLNKTQQQNSFTTISRFFTLPNDRGRYRDVTIGDLNHKLKEISKFREDTKELDISEVKIEQIEVLISDEEKPCLDDIGEAMQSLSELHWFPSAKNTQISTWAGWPKNIQAALLHSKTLQTFERHVLYEMIKQCKSFEAFLEILTKSLVYRELEVGTIIPAPRSDDPSKLEYYKVEKTIVTGKGFTAILLVPIDPNSKSKKILAVSGSNFHWPGKDTISCIIEDARCKLGSGAYESAEKALKELMKDIKEAELIVTGHSLGGTLAQYILAHFAEKIYRLVTYNSPGVNALVHYLLGLAVEKLNHKIIIDILETYLDLVQSAGGTHAGHHLGYEHPMVQLSLVRFQLGRTITTPHTYLCLSNPSKIDLKIDTYGTTSLHANDLKDRLGNQYRAEEMEPYLNNLTRDSVEVIRKTFGGLSIAPCLQLWRPIVRSIVPSRAIPSQEENLETIISIKPTK